VIRPPAYAIKTAVCPQHIHLLVVALPFRSLIAEVVLIPDEAYELANWLVDAAEAVDPPSAAKVRPPRIRVRPIAPGGLWSYACPAHPSEGIGLFHDQGAAIAAVDRHLAKHHS